jgi:hypothetical protein
MVQKYDVLFMWNTLSINKAWPTARASIFVLLIGTLRGVKVERAFFQF